MSYKAIFATMVQLSLTSATLEVTDELLLRQSLLYLFWMGTQGNPELLTPYVIDERLLPKLLAHMPGRNTAT